MKKQILKKVSAMLLAIILCMSLMTVPTSAATTNKIVINDVDITAAPNYTVQCGSGTAVYDPQAKTLTLNQAEITVGAIASSTSGERYGIAVKTPDIETLEIILIGENKITLEDSQYRNMGIWSTKSALKFSGEGSLNVSLYNEIWPYAIHTQGYDIEFDGVDIVCNQLNDAHKGYAILSNKTITATNSSFEVNGFETAIDAGSLVMKNSTLKTINSADWGIAVFADEMLIENSTVDAQVLDTGLYCWGNLTINSSTINCSSAYVGVYADSGNIVINGNSNLNLQNRTYGLRIYNGKLAVNSGTINAVGKARRGGISVLNEKGSSTEPPADAITLSANLTEMSDGKISTVEVMWDDGYNPPYPVYITSYIPKDDSTLATDLSNALVTVNINLKAADYSAVDNAIEAANKLDKDIYKDFSAVEAAIAAVVRDKKITDQAEVDAMAKAINDAIATLEKICNTASGIHEYTVPQNDDTHHWNKCSACAATDTKVEHSGTDDGDCTTEVKCSCGYIITAAKSHSFDNACDLDCNNTGCDHTRAINHTPNADDGDCTTAVRCAVCDTITTEARSAHSGGTATCTAKAKCEVCDTEYGEAIGHGETEIRNAKTASCDEEGYTGDKHCKVCGEKLEDGTAIAKTEHNYEWVIDKEPTATEEGLKHEECTVCKVKQNENTAIPKTETTSPQTGDNSNITLWIALLFISGMGLVGTTVYGRKKRTN